MGEFEGRKLERGVISHFDQMIQHSFMSLESTLELIDQSLRLTGEQSAERGLTVSIHAQVTAGDAAHEDDADSARTRRGLQGVYPSTATTR